MSDVTGSTQKDRAGFIKNKPDQKRVLQQTFSAEGNRQGSGLLQRENTFGAHTTARGEFSSSSPPHTSFAQRTAVNTAAVNTAATNAAPPEMVTDEAFVPLNAAPAAQVKPMVQTALQVNAPGDPYEQEADRVANEVMRMPASPLPLPLSGMNSFLTPTVNRFPTISQIQASGNQQGFQAPAGVENRINRMQGGGQSLPDTERDFFESRMGYNFSRVRIHTDGNAVQASRDIQAHAFTMGNNIAFNQGAYQPGTQAGRRLLAHELTHVVQQGGAGVQRKPSLKSLTAQTPPSQVMGHLQRLSQQPGFNAALYRKEIADFQASHSPAQIAAQQQQLLGGDKSPDIQQSDQSQTLRRCGGGNNNPPPPPPTASPTFKVTAFSATGSGNANLTEKNSGLTVRSPAFRSSGTVTVTGDATEVKKWDIGYIQTVFTYSLESEYEKTYDRWSMNTLPIRDGFSSSVVPWYHTFTAVSGSGASVSESMGDAPGHTVSWDDPRVTNPNSLVKYTRRETFVAWFIARNRDTQAIEYLKNISWGFNFVVDVDKTKPVGSRAKNSGAGMPAPTSGNGKGSSNPVLTAPIANDSQTRSIVAK